MFFWPVYSCQREFRFNLRRQNITCFKSFSKAVRSKALLLGLYSILPCLRKISKYKFSVCIWHTFISCIDNLAKISSKAVYIGRRNKGRKKGTLKMASQIFFFELRLAKHILKWFFNIMLLRKTMGYTELFLTALI